MKLEKPRSDKDFRKFELEKNVDDCDHMISRARTSIIKAIEMAMPSIRKYWEEDLQYWLEKKEKWINHITYYKNGKESN